jgi:DNA gyrase subunit A
LLKSIHKRIEMAKKDMIQEELIPERILPRNVEDEMRTSYIDYAMSVIVGRALPDIRDGLKPVHRRILYTMKEMGLKHNTAYKKSARVVGDVLGKYHPHGDTAVYDSMVRMVQDFSLRYPLVDGQGNFGSVDGDPPAAMRYTEVRLRQISEEVISDIDKGTVDFVPNYDGSLSEPSIMPSKLPNLLVNGSSGIAVGMATNIPPHNLTEVCDAVAAFIDNNMEMTTEDLLKIMKGPDFPTSGIIYGRDGIKDYFETGRGSITIRAKVEIEEIKGGRQAIIVNELPYQVNKAQLLTNIVELVRDKKLDGISDLRDESDRDGIRVVIEVKRDENANVVLNNLMKHTQFQVSFGVIMLSLVGGEPKILPMRQMLHEYIKHRQNIIVRRAKFELDKAEKRAHILEGLKIALDNLNRVIKAIRESKDTETAEQRLMKEFELSKLQADAILEMRLHQLTGLERKKIDDEYLALIKEMERLKSLLADPKKVLGVIKEELKELKEKYGDERRTKIVARTVEVDIEDLIQEEDVVVTLSHAGYIKRIPMSTYRSQRRGGKGVTAMTTREEDFVEDLFITNTHSYMLLFTNKGRVYSVRVFEIPEGSRVSKGKAIVNLLQLSSLDEKVTAAISVKSFEEEKASFLLMCTKYGIVKKTELGEYGNIRKSGIIAVNLDEGDMLIDVKHTDGKSEAIIGTRAGMAIRFKESDVRTIGRTGRGVRGIRLAKDDEVIGMEAVGSKDILLTATENGFGKRTEISRYRLQSRGGKGVKNIKASARNGQTIGIKKANNGDELMMITSGGITIRLPIDEILVKGRNIQGVRLVRLEPEDKLAGIAYIAKEDDADGNEKLI